MLSPHPTTLLFNSPKKMASRQKHSLLAKTSSSTLLRSVPLEKQDVEKIDEEKPSYSRLLKQKDLKILNLTEKLKNSQNQLAFYKNDHSTLSSDLKFFKSKIQEEFYRNTCLESEIEIINTTLKSFIKKMVGLLEGSQKSVQCVARHLQSLKVENTESDHLLISKALLNTMEFQINELTKSFYLLKKEPETQKLLIKSADLKIQPQNITDEAEKETLRKRISTLVDYYETRLVDSDDYKEEIQHLRDQREYVKELLMSSEKEKNLLVNEVYQLARKQYMVDFEMMSKGQAIKFCMSLLAKFKDIEKDKKQLQEQLRILSTTEKEKYESMLKMVKRLDKSQEKKLSFKRLVS